eukprot:1175639-Prorocentrum_minimum.AAC.2
MDPRADSHPQVLQCAPMCPNVPQCAPMWPLVRPCGVAAAAAALSIRPHSVTFGHIRPHSVTFGHIRLAPTPMCCTRYKRTSRSRRG